MQVSYPCKDHGLWVHKAADLLHPNLMKGHGLTCPSHPEAANLGNYAMCLSHEKGGPVPQLVTQGSRPTLSPAQPLRPLLLSVPTNTLRQATL